MNIEFQRHPPKSSSQMLHSAHFLHIFLHTAYSYLAFQSKNNFFFKTEALYRGANRCTMEVTSKTRISCNSFQQRLALLPYCCRPL